MISVTKIFEFEAAHCLDGHPGKCAALHGHSYKLEIEVMRNPHYGNLENDMVLDFGDLKKIIKPIVDGMDHSLLNDYFMTKRPTAEYMVMYLKDHVSWPDYIIPVRIRIWETSTSYAEWKKDK